MERNFTNENFERFLKQNAEQFRMRPSDKVWGNISKTLNGGKKRYTLGIISFFLIISMLGYIAIESSNSDLASLQNKKQNTGTVSSPVVNNENTLDNRSNTSPRSTLIPTSALSNQTQRGFNYQPFSLEGFEKNIVPEVYPFESSVIDSDITAEEQKETNVTVQEKAKEDLLTIESVLNTYKANRRKRLSFQFFFTPTISYRKLSENKSYLRAVGSNIPPGYPSLYNDVNNQVTHKPDMGLEFGFTAKYPLTKKLNVRAGMQFNINRYDIKAFKSSSELATIRLNNNSRRPDSLVTVSNLSNVNGYRTNWLQNFYFQVSAPVGVEYIIKNNGNVKFGVASTIQPTYVLSERAYLISSDYKSYSEVPWLTRKWNVATGLETFVGYSTGKLSWQVGPQVRYQLLSSFIDKYPVKENLFDFGLKVGISLNNQ
jgi:hypothetical protein